MKRLMLSVSIAACCLLAACAEQATDPALTDEATTVSADPAGGDAAPAATDVAGADVATTTSPDLPEDSPVWFEPARMDGCQPAVAGVIHWDASAFPGVQAVKVALPAEDGTESVFAVSGVQGEKATGEWLGAGTEVILRDNASDEELARVRMPGEPCEG